MQKALRCEGGGTPFGKFTEVRITSRRPSFYMCTSELGAGGDKIPLRYAVLDRSCTRLGFRYREPEPKTRIWDQTPTLVQREGAALPYTA